MKLFLALSALFFVANNSNVQAMYREFDDEDVIYRQEMASRARRLKTPLHEAVARGEIKNI